MVRDKGQGVLPTPSKITRDRAIRAMRFQAALLDGDWSGNPDRYKWGDEAALRVVAKWLESMGDEPEEAGGNG